MVTIYDSEIIIRYLKITVLATNNTMGTGVEVLPALQLLVNN